MMKSCCCSVLLCTALLTLTAACDTEPPVPTNRPETTDLMPVPPPALEPSEEPAVKPPHAGRLAAMPDAQGYVEWVADAGRLYFLDAAGRPATGAERVVLTIQSPEGPWQVAMTACEDHQFAGACWMSPGGELRADAAAAVVRFELDGQAIRIVLPVETSSSRTETPGTSPGETQSMP